MPIIFHHLHLRTSSGENRSSIIFYLADINFYSIDSLIGAISRLASSRVLSPKFWCKYHGAIIPPGYVSVSVDRVNKGFSDLALDILGGDGEKTLGEAEKTFILWRKRYIIIPGVSSPPLLPQLPDNRCGQK